MTRIQPEAVVVGVDSTPCSEDALEWAAREAAATGRSLAIVSVWHWSSSVMTAPLSVGPAEDPRTQAKTVLRRAASRARSFGARTTTHLLEGSPVTALVEASERAAMLVVGAHGRGRLSRAMLGSVSDGCVRHASCPVVVIPARHHAAVAGANSSR